MLIWDVFTGLKTHAIPLSNTWPIALAAWKTGRHIAVGGLDNVVSIYKVDTIEDQMFSAFNTFQDNSHESPLLSSSVGNDSFGDFNAIGGKKKIGSMFQISPTSASFAESYQMSNMNGNVPVCSLRGHQGYISSIEFLTEEKVISGSGDMSVSLWDLTKGVKIKEYVDRNLGDVSSLCLHPTNPNIFVSASLRTVKVWDVRLKTSLQSFSDHSGDVNVVQMFPDGNAVMTGSDDCRLFDLRSDCQVACFENPNAPLFTKYNSTSTGRQSMAAMTPRTPKTPLSPAFSNNITIESMSASLVQHNELQRQSEYHSVCEIKFTPSGRLLFAAYEDGNWGAWDVLKGKYLGNLPKIKAKEGKNAKTGFTFPLQSSSNYSHDSQNSGSSGQITSIQITKDGSRIYTSERDLMIRGYCV